MWSGMHFRTPSLALRSGSLRFFLATPVPTHMGRCFHTTLGSKSHVRAEKKYTCMRICIYTYEHVHILYVYLCDMYVYMYMRMCICMYVRAHARTHIRTYVCMYVCMYMTHIYLYIDIHAYACIRMYTHKSEQKMTPALTQRLDPESMQDHGLLGSVGMFWAIILPTLRVQVWGALRLKSLAWMLLT